MNIRLIFDICSLSIVRLSTNKIGMSLDVVRGMIHLHSEGLIHRDLAARNLLVATKADKGYLIKVSGIC